MSGLIDVGRAIGAALIAKTIVKPWAKIGSALASRAAEGKLERFQRVMGAMEPDPDMRAVFARNCLEDLAALPAPSCPGPFSRALIRAGYARREARRDLPTILGADVVTEARARGLI